MIEKFFFFFSKLVPRYEHGIYEYTSTLIILVKYIAYVELYILIQFAGVVVLLRWKKVKHYFCHEGVTHNILKAKCNTENLLDIVSKFESYAVASKLYPDIKLDQRSSN